MVITILGLDAHPSAAIRWSTYKLRLAERGELVNVGTSRPEQVREIMAALVEKMSANRPQLAKAATP